MRILLDECAPRPLKRELADYEIRTVFEMGWSIDCAILDTSTSLSTSYRLKIKELKH